MAGNVVVRKLEKITPPQVLLDGMTLWKWEEVRRNDNGCYIYNNVYVELNS